MWSKVLFVGGGHVSISSIDQSFTQSGVHVNTSCTASGLDQILRATKEMSHVSRLGRVLSSLQCGASWPAGPC